jgi:hypothetical protein
MLTCLLSPPRVSSWNSIKGSIPAGITAMTLLTAIDFYSNAMSGSIPAVSV